MEMQNGAIHIPADMATIMINSLHENMESWLPPGFRFHPTDEELINHYLIRKVLENSFTSWAIAEVDLNKCEPWDLKERARMVEKELYFFALRDRKYPTGMRTNRATQAGYWKATGKDRDVVSSKSASLVGMKKTLVFYRGRAPKGEKTNWIMHEYRLEGNISHLQNCKWSKQEGEWVVCRIFQKMPGGKKALLRNIFKENLYSDLDTHSSLPPLLESPNPTPNDSETDGNSVGHQDDHLSSLFKCSNPSHSNSNTQIVRWSFDSPKIESSNNKGSVGDPKLDVVSCNDYFNHIGLISNPSFAELYNANTQTCESSTSSINAPNFRQSLTIPQGQALGSTQSSISWKEGVYLPKALSEEGFRLLERDASFSPFKPEPYNGTVQHRSSPHPHKHLGQSEWMGDSMEYENSDHFLQLQSSLTTQDPLNEPYDMSAGASTGVELECIWSC